MINYQKYKEPESLSPIEIDAVIIDLNIKLRKNIDWLSNANGRIYRNFENNDGRKVYYPEVYIGLNKKVPTYAQVKPDNDKKAISYFVVSDERISDFKSNNYNFLNYDVGLVFWINIDLINKESLKTELITQNLISEVRSVLTRKLIGINYSVTIKSVQREYKDVFSELGGISEDRTNKAPFQSFKFNLEIKIRENCNVESKDYKTILNNNFNQIESAYLLNKLNFDDDSIFAYLSDDQKTQLLNQLNKNE